MAGGVTIRALVQIDRLQPKFAAYNGATVRGSIPLAGDTVLIGELAPGNEVFALVDAALKASRVEAASQIVEREFGFFILRSPLNAEVSAARDAILSRAGLQMRDRLRPTVESTQIITSVEPYQAQLLNKWSSGSLVVPGRTLGILECAPAAYVALAANEAEKAAEIDIVEVRAVGRYGRFLPVGRRSVGTDRDRGRNPRTSTRWTDGRRRDPEATRHRRGARRAGGPPRAPAHRGASGQHRHRPGARRPRRAGTSRCAPVPSTVRPWPGRTGPPRSGAVCTGAVAKWMPSRPTEGRNPGTARAHRRGRGGRRGHRCGASGYGSGGAADEIALVDIVPDLAASIALDLNHATGITRSPSRAEGRNRSRPPRRIRRRGRHRGTCAQPGHAARRPGGGEPAHRRVGGPKRCGPPRRRRW